MMVEKEDKFVLDDALPQESGGWDCKGEKRCESDLDSITVGSSSKLQFKLYFNSRTDTAMEVEERIAWIAGCARYARSQHEKVMDDV